MKPKIFERIAAFVADYSSANEVTKLNEDFNRITVYLNEHFEDGSLVAELAKWPEELKILMIQQFFRHEQLGSHQTSFNLKKVNRLLSEWFNIEIKETPNKDFAIVVSLLPGRLASTGIYNIDFGGTQFYFHISKEHHIAAQKLINVICDNAILTTEKTSPPCEMSEIVPLWLKDRTLENSQYYIQDGQAHVIEAYFSTVQSSLQRHFGFEVLEPSMEMAIVTNGDALRFHRDRLVNQYEFLDQSEAPRYEYSVAQCLTLISWDMQPDTLSGTIFDHPNGDRYVFCLYPGEIVNIVFTEDAQPIGTMMMPYHCALPVVDLSAENTVGGAKGKRFSTVLRGLVKKQALELLVTRAEALALTSTIDLTYHSQILSQQKELSKILFSNLKRLSGTIMEGDYTAVSVMEISAEGNEMFFEDVAKVVSEATKVFRVTKYSPGFSDLSTIIPGYNSANRVIGINRSQNCPAGSFCYPLAFDFSVENKPWIQLVPIALAHAFEISKESRFQSRLSPAEEIFHRSALTDSFHQLATLKPRFSIMVDFIVTI